MAKEWYIQDVLGIVQGPYTSSAIRGLAKDGTLLLHTLVAQSRNGPWIEGSRVRGLSELISKPVQPIAPTIGEPNQVEQRAAHEPNRSASMRTITVGRSGLSPLAFIFTVLLTTFVMCTLIFSFFMLLDRRPTPAAFNPLRYDLSDPSEIWSAFSELKDSERGDPELMLVNFLDVVYNRVWAGQATRERSLVLRHRGIQAYFAASWNPELRQQMVWEIENKGVRDRSLAYLPLRTALFEWIARELRGGKTLDEIVERICPQSNAEGHEPNSWEAELLATTVRGLEIRNNLQRNSELDENEKQQYVNGMVHQYARKSIYKAANQ